jgi:uncharacterized membrane protein (DUF4010 family)
MAPVVNQLTVVAMFVRNLALLAVFSTAAGMVAAWPIGAMAAVSAVYVFGRWRRIDASGSIQLGSPVELRKVTSFGLLFLIIQWASAIAQKLLGSSAVIATLTASITSMLVNLPIVYGQLKGQAADPNTNRSFRRCGCGRGRGDGDDVGFLNAS